MNPASFNHFIALLEDISADVLATDTTRKAILDTASTAVDNLFKYTENCEMLA